MADKAKAEQQQQPGGGRGIKMAPSNQPIEEVYVDGVLGLFARAGVIKINLYRVLGTDSTDDSEVRSVSHRLVMPAAALPEMARLLQNVAKAANEQAQQAQAAAASESAGDTTVDTGVVDPESLI